MLAIMANILIVHAHHEPLSFSSSLAKTAAETLAHQGHEVVLSDLYALGFDPVSDRRNFVTSADASYLKQQDEEAHASEHAGFAPEVETEMRKVEACDFLIFSFPLWWFGMPAILKGWVDRVFAYSRFYGGGFWYENGSGKGKRAMVLVTTGGGEAMYGGRGMHPSLEAILTPVHRGIFWFNGFSPLPPFVAWSAAHGSDADRHEVLDEWRGRLANVFGEAPLRFPHAADFDPETHADTVPRFMVTLRQKRPADERYRELGPDQISHWERCRREGRVVSAQTAPWESVDWRGFILFRERSGDAVASACRELTISDYLDFEITPLDGGN